jgi:hypothetical protein
MLCQGDQPVKLARLTDDNLHKALAKLAALPLPAKTAFKLKGLNKRVSEELGKYDELRVEALKRFGKKKEDGSIDMEEGGNVRFDREGMDGFVAYLQELTNQDIDLPTIKIDDLGNVELTAQELSSLDGLIVE